MEPRYFAAVCCTSSKLIGRHEEYDLYYCPVHSKILAYGSDNSVGLTAALDTVTGLLALTSGSFNSYMGLADRTKRAVTACLIEANNYLHDHEVGDALSRLKG